MDRRTYLRTLAGVNTVAFAGCFEFGDGQPTDSPPPERSPRPRTGSPTSPTPTDPGEGTPTPALTDRYSNVVDMVADAGCDPGGSEPCGPQLREAAGDDTLLVFPEGAYHFAGRNALHGLRNFGIVGRGNVRFTAPPGTNGAWFVVDQGRDLLFQNVDVDARADNCAPTLKLGVMDGLEVRDVEVLGRGMRQGSKPRGEGGNPEVGNAFLPIVRSPDGSGVVERFVARKGGRIGTYNHGNGRVGIFIGASHQGTLRLVDCRLEEFPSNGIYASRTQGQVHVQGGRFRNNDISQVRLGSEGSVVDGADIQVDVAAVTGPNEPGDYLNPRGVRIESGSVNTEGAAVQNTKIHVKNSPGSGIAVSRNAGQFVVRNSEIRVDSDGSWAILAKPPTGGPYQPPPPPNDGVVENVEITGDASGQGAIWFIGRPGSRLANVTISQGGSNRGGIYLDRSPGTVVQSVQVDVSGLPLVVPVPSDASEDCLVQLDGVSLPARASVAATGQRSVYVQEQPGESICIARGDLLLDGVGDPAVVVVDSGDGYSLRVVPGESVQMNGG